ncbi:MAG: deaminase [Candidatus Paceibacterota bacterium]|jgi:dCMP deaminase
MMSLDWQNLLKIAYTKAQGSTNPSTQNGAILIEDDGSIVLSAINSFPDGVVETQERQKKPLRYKFSVHAERNVLYRAALLGIKTKGLTMVCPWAACSDCAQAIIQTGIRRLVTHKQALDRSNTWQEDIELAFTMLREAGVEIIIFGGKIGAGKILRSGEFWKP